MLRLESWSPWPEAGAAFAMLQSRRMDNTSSAIWTNEAMSFMVGDWSIFLIEGCFG